MNVLVPSPQIGTKFKSLVIKSKFYRRIRKNGRFYKFLRKLNRYFRRPKKTPLELLFGYELIKPTELVTIYCDVAGIRGVPFIDGTRRVGNYFIEHLSQLQNSKFRIEFVEWDGKTFVGVNNHKESNIIHPRRRIEWNPKKSDFLFLQTMEAVARIRESKVNELNEKIKIVTLIHDILPINEPKWFTKEMVGDFEENLKFAFLNSTLLVVSSKTVENDLRAIPLLKNLEITLPRVERVDISSVFKNFNPSEKIPKHKKLNEEVVILLISTIEPRKGYDELVDAASQALTQGVNLKFIIVGRLGWVSDSFYSKFVKFSETFPNNVLWLKNCSDAMLVSLMPTVDIFLSPTRGEGFGIPVAEALNAGVPTLARDLPVYRELYDPYVAFYGPDNDFPDLYSALIHIEKIQEIASTKVLSFPPTDCQASINSLIEVFSTN